MKPGSFFYASNQATSTVEMMMEATKHIVAWRAATDGQDIRYFNVNNSARRVQGLRCVRYQFARSRQMLEHLVHGDQIVAPNCQCGVKDAMVRISD